MIGHLNGKVEKVISGNFPGVGIVVVETYKDRNGDEKQERAVAWFDRDPNFVVGQSVHLKGIVRSRVNTYTDRNGQEQTRAELSLSNATQFELAKAKPQQSASEAFAAIGATPLEDAPF